MPAQVPLSIYRGDSEHWTFTLFTDLNKTQPYDLAGATAKAEVRIASGDPVLTTFVCTVVLPNEVDVDLHSTDSADIDWASGKWDLQLTWPGTPPKVKTVVAGPVAVEADITDSSPGMVVLTTPAPSMWRRREQAS